MGFLRRFLAGVMVLGIALAFPLPTLAGDAEETGLANFSQGLSEAHARAVLGDLPGEEAALDRAASALERLERNPSNALLGQDFSALVEQHRFGRAHRAERTTIDALYREAANRAPTPGGFYEHLADALRLHQERVPVYAGKTGGRSTPLFRKIDSLQRLNLPMAWYIDLRARPFHRQGIPIINGDIVSMSLANPLDTPSHHRGRVRDDTLEELRGRIRAFQREANHEIRAARFFEVASRTAALIRHLQDIERREDCHMAMTIHILESFGLVALHGERWKQVSKGETAGLTRLFLTIHVFTLQECLKTDRKAQEIQADGIGVIVNDVPPVPFLQEWEAGRKPR